MKAVQGSKREDRAAAMFYKRLFSTSLSRLSNIGSKPIMVPKEVDLQLAPLKKNIIKRKGRVLLTLSQLATVKGPKGELELEMPDFVQFGRDNDKLSVSVKDAENKQQRALWGTMRSLISNNIVGVTDGHLAILKLVGTGYRAAVETKDGKPWISLKVGASIPQGLLIPENLTVTSPSTTRIIVEGVDRQQVKLFAARIREFHPPEPYKGKGIYLDDEKIVLKAKKIK